MKKGLLLAVVASTVIFAGDGVPKDVPSITLPPSSVVQYTEISQNVWQQDQKVNISKQTIADPQSIAVSNRLGSGVGDVYEGSKLDKSTKGEMQQLYMTVASVSMRSGEGGGIMIQTYNTGSSTTNHVSMPPSIRLLGASTNTLGV